MSIIDDLQDCEIIVPFTDHPITAFENLKQSLLNEQDLIFYLCKQYEQPDEKNVRIIDYFLLKEYLYTRHHDHNTAWNPHAQQALLIFGKIYREHRFDVLRNLIHSGTLTTENYNWSLGLYDIQQNTSVYNKNLNRIQNSDLDFDQINQLCRNLEADDDQYWGFSGYPYSTDVYKDALYNVVMETYVQEPNCLISEKTWKSISNHTPFISVVSEWQMQELHSQGFHTFTEYYLKPGEQYCVETISKNFSEYSERFRANILNNTSEISDKVEHNYENFIRLAKLEQQKHQDLFTTPIYFRHKNDKLTRADYPNFFFHNEVYDFGRSIITTTSHEE
jgi:hypothetical protein